MEPSHHFDKTLKGKKNSPGTFETSKYQNLPMYHFQKWLGFAIFCEFDTCHKEITIDSLVGSPCSLTNPVNCQPIDAFVSKS